MAGSLAVTTRLAGVFLVGVACILLTGGNPVAAGDTGESAPAGSCNVHENLGFCYEFVGEAASEDGMKSECDGADGVFAPAPCPREGVLGTCVFDPEGRKEHRIIYYFYADSFTLKTAKMSCPGTFFEN